MTTEFSVFMRLLRSQLTTHRLAMNLTLKEAAQRAMLSRGGLEKIESGDNLPSIESLYNICKLYGMSLSEFFDTIESQQQLSANVRTQFKKEIERLSSGQNLQSQDLPLETKESLKQQIFSELAREAGLEEQVQTAFELATLQKKNKELFKAISTTIHCLVVDRRRSKAAAAASAEAECPDSATSDYFA